MVADETTEETRGRAYGYRKMMDQLGAVLGPLTVFFMLPYLTVKTSPEEAYRTIFWISFLPAILAVLVLYFVKEKAAKITADKKISISIALGPEFKKFVLVTLVFAFGMFSYSFMILKAQEVGVDVNLIPLLYLSYNVSYMLFAMPFGKRSDRVGRKNVLALGYVLFGLMCVGLVYSRTTLHVWSMFLLYGVFMAIMETVQRAFISDIVSSEVRGTAMGLHQGAVGFAALPANLIVGLLWSRYGSAAAFAYSIVVSLVAVVLLAFLVNEKKREEDS